MSDFYDDMQGIASNLLNEFKQGEIKYIAVIPGIGPADNPGASQEVPYILDAVAKGVSFRYIDHTNILATDLQITMPGAGVVPLPNGFMMVDGVRHKIIQIIPKPAAGTPVAFSVIIRK